MKQCPHCIGSGAACVTTLRKDRYAVKRSLKADPYWGGKCSFCKGSGCVDNVVRQRYLHG